MKSANAYLRIEPLALGAICILGAWLRLYRLGGNSLWVDEIGQILVARNGVQAAIVGASSHYGAAPLDYVLTAITLHLGQSEFALRLPSAIWGTLSIPLIYWFVQLLWQSVPVSLLAALLLALSPTTVELAQEVRWYSLSTMLALLNGCLFLVALRTKRTAHWVLLAIGFLLAVMTALFHVFVIAALGLALLFFWTQERWGLEPASPDGKLATNPAALGPPPLRVGLSDLAHFGLTVLAPAAFAIYWYVSGALRHDTTGAFTFTPVPYRELSTYPLFGSYGVVLHPWPLYRELAGPIVFPLLVTAGLATAAVRRQAAALVPALIVAVTGVGIFAVDAASGYFWAYRQFLLIVPFYLSLAAFGLWSMVLLMTRKPRQQVLATAALLLPLLWLTIPQLQDYYHYAKTNWRDTAAILALAAKDPANHVTIAADWQPYVFYYAPELRDKIVNLAPSSGGEAPPDGKATRIWYLGPSETLAASILPAWQVNVVMAEPTLPIYVASADPGQEWLLQLTQEPLPPIIYRYNLLYTLAAADPARAHAVGDQIMASVWDNSTLLNARQRADLAAIVGRVRFDAGQTETSLALLRAAVRYDSASQEALETLGYVLMQMGNTHEAGKMFQQSIWHHPRSYWAHASLANIYAYEKEWETAASYHVKAWELAYDPAMRAEQAAAADAAYQAAGDDGSGARSARTTFSRRVQEESEQ